MLEEKQKRIQCNENHYPHPGKVLIWIDMLK